MAVFLGLLIGGKLFGILGFILSIPAIAIGKVFFKFGRELYQDSYFYNGVDRHPYDQPSDNMEERFAEAADTVLAKQEKEDEEGNEAEQDGDAEQSIKR